MIEFPLEVGILCWVSTAIFWAAGFVAIWKIVKAILNNNPLKQVSFIKDALNINKVRLLLFNSKFTTIYFVGNSKITIFAV